MRYNPVIIGIDTGVTGKAVTLDLSRNVEERVTVFSMPSVKETHPYWTESGRYINAPILYDKLLSNMFSYVARFHEEGSPEGMSPTFYFYVEKSATGQRVRGVHTAAANFGITAATCSMLGETHIVHAKTWQAAMKRYADEGDWVNKKSNRPTKNLPSLIAYAFAPHLVDEVNDKEIEVDDNLADAICIALYGAIDQGLINKILIKG